jgi:hypothetical protein
MHQPVTARGTKKSEEQICILMATDEQLQRYMNIKTEGQNWYERKYKNKKKSKAFME